ncbi:MAG: hypothetical protein OHK0038_21460 [Flammeovirgaceae bacterium]
MSNNNSNIVESSLGKTRKTRILPNSQFDLLNLAEAVSTKWLASPQITLLWIKASEFKNLVEQYRNLLSERVNVGSGRSLQTQTLKELDADISKAVEEVKIAIMAKFGKEKGKAYFAEFGITKQNNSYKLPADRNLKINSLPLLVKGVQTYQLNVVGFDSNFFANLVSRYQTALNDAKVTDSNVSISVGNKNDLKNQIQEVINALLLLIKANYPKTYENELRGWGFQKEKY